MAKKELPWAYPKRKHIDPKAPGLSFFYFRTKAEAEKSAKVARKHNQCHGPVEYRPGECFQLGYVL